MSAKELCFLRKTFQDFSPYNSSMVPPSFNNPSRGIRVLSSGTLSYVFFFCKKHLIFFACSLCKHWVGASAAMNFEVGGAHTELDKRSV